MCEVIIDLQINRIFMLKEFFKKQKLNDHLELNYLLLDIILHETCKFTVLFCKFIVKFVY